MDFTDTDTGDSGADSPAVVVEDSRPPAPDEATPEQVERYNRQYLEKNNVEMDPGPTRTDPEESPFAKESNELGADVKHKSEFPWLYDPNRGVRWDFDPISLRNLAQGDPWVGMLIQSITKEVAETPWTIVEADDQMETQKRLSTHPEERSPVEKSLPDSTSERIYELLSDPAPDVNWQDAVEMWLGDLLEVGSMTAVKAYPQSAYDGDDLTADPASVEPRALQPSAPEVWTKDYHGKTGVVNGYWQFDDHKSPGAGGDSGRSAGRRGMNNPTFFDTPEVMWDDMTPRSNRRYGMPPTLLVEDFLQSIDLAVTQEQQYLSRGSIPSGAWVFENWDREEVREWKEENAENVKGKPHKSLMFAGQGGGVSFEPMSMNFSELEFTERQKWYARVIASAFQVPTAVVGIEPERVNYNTFQGERENFESNTLGPYLQQLERVINDQFVRPHWGGEYRFEFKPGMSESTRAMISERVRSEFNANLRTRSSAMRELGIEEPEEMEDGFKEDVVSDDGGGPFDNIEMSMTSQGDGEVSKNPNHSKDGDMIRCENTGETIVPDRIESNGGECPECGEDVAADEVMLSKFDPVTSDHQFDPGAGVGVCENTGKEFDAETFGDLEGECPHCGGDVLAVNPEGTGKDAGAFTADVFRTIAPDDADYVSERVTGIGVDFPNDGVYVDWRNEVFEDELQNSHVSIYGSLDDLEQATGVDTETIDSLDATVAEKMLGDEIVEKVRGGGSGNCSHAVEKDEPLRETDEWYQFDVQPGDIEALREDIADDVEAVYDEVLEDDEVARIIERMAADETEKSVAALSRRLREIFEESEVVARIERALRDGTSEAVVETVQDAISEADSDDVDVDVKAIREQLSDRSVGFADKYADQMREDIRETVGDGWAEGKNSREIASEISEQADMEKGWGGAERIARQELQVATGRARSRVAEDLGKVEVWSTAGDDRVRPAHEAMDGAWCRAGDSFVVEYENRGVEKEDVPGSSEPGIGCRCVTLLRDRSEVDDADYAGDGSV